MPMLHACNHRAEVEGKSSHIFPFFLQWAQLKEPGFSDLLSSVDSGEGISHSLLAHTQPCHLATLKGCAKPSGVFPEALAGTLFIVLVNVSAQERLVGVPIIHQDVRRTEQMTSITVFLAFTS